MASRLVLKGFPEFRAELRRLPDVLAGNGSQRATDAAKTTEATVRTAYRSRSGQLEAGLSVTLTRTGGGMVARVANALPLARWYEYGTQGRHTRLGAWRGSMPAAHVFVPTAIRQRRLMVDGAIADVQRAGLIVNGHAGSSDL